MFDNKNDSTPVKLCCCCCNMEQRSYFKCFTIILLITNLVEYVSAIFSIIRKPSVWTVLSAVIVIIFFLIVLYMMYVFCRRGEYGSYLNYCYSLVNFIVAIFSLIGAIILGIFLILGGVFISNMFEGMSITGITISYWLITIPLIIYYVYLCYCYFQVINTESIRVENGDEYNEYRDNVPMVNYHN